MLRRIFVRIVSPGLFVLLAVSAYASAVPGGFVETPDTCLTLSQLTHTEIHLTAVGKCEGKPGRVFVEVKPGETRTVIADGTVIGKKEVRPLEVVDVAAALEKGLKLSETMNIPENAHTPAMEKVAKDTSDLYYSQEFQDKLKRETERLKGDMFGSSQVPTYYADAIADTSMSALGEDERVYVFISSSMPVPVLRTYAADIAKLKDKRVVLVMRGFINGMQKISSTISFFAEVLKRQPNCEIGPGKQCEMNNVSLIVDPLLFRKYNVERVPTFVYAKGMLFGNPNMSEGVAEHITKEGQSYMVAGDANFGYILRKLAEASNSESLMKLGAVQ